MLNTYILKVGGKETTVKGVNLRTAVESEGYEILSMNHEHFRKPNGKYVVKCINNVTIYAEWVEKFKSKTKIDDVDKPDWFERCRQGRLNSEMDGQPLSDIFY